MKESNLCEINEDALVFIGDHPDTGKPICGLITSDFDLENAPIKTKINGDILSVIGVGRRSRYRLSKIMIELISAETDFYIGNVGGTGESFKARLVSS